MSLRLIQLCCWLVSMAMRVTARVVHDEYTSKVAMFDAVAGTRTRHVRCSLLTMGPCSPVNQRPNQSFGAVLSNNAAANLILSKVEIKEILLLPLGLCNGFTNALVVSAVVA